MNGLLLLVLTIGVADSINPSTLGPALYLATTKRPVRRLAGFILGVFVVYLAGGLVLLLGPGRYLIAKVPHPGHTTVHWLELAAGIALLAGALVLWRVRGRVDSHLQARERKIGGSSILLGGGIMAVELPTALPYFAVIAALADSNESTAAQIALLVLFNVLFVLPLAAILVVVWLAGERGARLLERVHAYLYRRASVLLPAVVFAGAGVLLVLGAVGLTR
jgi:cytochrome c biogenesis protein CcdA